MRVNLPQSLSNQYSQGEDLYITYNIYKCNVKQIVKVHFIKPVEVMIDQFSIIKGRGT